MPQRKKKKRPTKLVACTQEGGLWGGRIHTHTNRKRVKIFLGYKIDFKHVPRENSRRGGGEYKDNSICTVRGTRVRWVAIGGEHGTATYPLSNGGGGAGEQAITPWGGGKNPDHLNSERFGKTKAAKDVPTYHGIYQAGKKGGKIKEISLLASATESSRSGETTPASDTTSSMQER